MHQPQFEYEHRAGAEQLAPPELEIESGELATAHTPLEAIQYRASCELVAAAPKLPQPDYFLLETTEQTYQLLPAHAALDEPSLASTKQQLRTMQDPELIGLILSHLPTFQERQATKPDGLADELALHGSAVRWKETGGLAFYLRSNDTDVYSFALPRIVLPNTEDEPSVPDLSPEVLHTDTQPHNPEDASQTEQLPGHFSYRLFLRRKGASFELVDEQGTPLEELFLDLSDPAECAEYHAILDALQESGNASTSRIAGESQFDTTYQLAGTLPEEGELTPIDVVSEVIEVVPFAASDELAEYDNDDDLPESDLETEQIAPRADAPGPITQAPADTIWDMFREPLIEELVPRPPLAVHADIPVLTPPFPIEQIGIPDGIHAAPDEPVLPLLIHNDHGSLALNLNRASAPVEQTESHSITEQHLPLEETVVVAQTDPVSPMSEHPNEVVKREKHVSREAMHRPAVRSQRSAVVVREPTLFITEQSDHPISYATETKPNRHDEGIPPRQFNTEPVPVPRRIPIPAQKEDAAARIRESVVRAPAEPVSPIRMRPKNPTVLPDAKLPDVSTSSIAQYESNTIASQSSQLEQRISVQRGMTRTGTTQKTETVAKTTAKRQEAIKHTTVQGSKVIEKLRVGSRVLQPSVRIENHTKRSEHAHQAHRQMVAQEERQVTTQTVKHIERQVTPVRTQVSQRHSTQTAGTQRNAHTQRESSAPARQTVRRRQNRQRTQKNAIRQHSQALPQGSQETAKTLATSFLKSWEQRSHFTGIRQLPFSIHAADEGVLLREQIQPLRSLLRSIATTTEQHPGVTFSIAINDGALRITPSANNPTMLAQAMTALDRPSLHLVPNPMSYIHRIGVIA